MTTSISIDVTQIDTVPTAKLGQYFTDQLGNVFRYVKGAGTVAQYEYAIIATDGSSFTLAAATTTNVPAGKVVPIGCWQNATSLTSSTYGWVQVKGYHTGKFAANYAANTRTCVTATAGVVDDALTTLITGLTGTLTIVGAQSMPAYAACEMYASGQAV